LILADDLGYGDIGCYGSPDVPTPHIDSIARDGVRFTDGYVSCAVCSPSRAALLTGQYQNRFGHEFNPERPEHEVEINFGLPDSARILPQYLKPAGYRSGMVGKWHLGGRPGFRPLERGFDEFYGFLGGASAYVTAKTPGASLVPSGDGREALGQPRDIAIMRGQDTIEEDRYLTDVFGQEAAAFIDRNRRQPFFLHLSFNAVHTPLHATAKYLNRFAGIKNERHRQLAAMTSAMDDAIGVVLGKLREKGLDKETMVVFLSDNGCPEVTGAGTNGPLAGEKASYFEGGIRVPFAMRWPGKLPAGKVFREAVTARDIVPTFLAAASLQSQTAFDGVDIIPYLQGIRGGRPHGDLFWRAGEGRAMRRANWKLVENGNSFSGLFDLAKDIGESRDLSSEHPAVLAGMRSAWKAWSDSMTRPRWPSRRFRKVTVNGVTTDWQS